MAIKSNVPASKVNTNAKGKAPSKADLARLLEERAIASATKKLANVTLEAAMQQYATGEIKVEGLRNVYAMAMNERFSFCLTAHKLHWSVIWDSKNAKHNESNLNPIWKEIEEQHQALLAFLKGKHSNAPQVWKRTKERAYQIAFPGQKRAPRQPKLPAENAIEKLIAAYRAVAKETVQSERDEQIADVLGHAIIALKLDLNKINQSLNV